MSDFQPFSPKRGSNQVLTPAAGAAIATIDSQKTCMQVRIANTGANICYVATYGSDETAYVATVADHAVAAGQTSVITKPMSHNLMSHISAAGTTIQVSVGNGW